MITVQLGVSLAEALLRLRAHAYDSGQTVTDVAAEVVNRLPIPGATHPAAASGAPITAEMVVATTLGCRHPVEVVRVATESVVIDAG